MAAMAASPLVPALATGAARQPSPAVEAPGTGAARRARERRKRCAARRIAWITGLYQSAAGHHTHVGGGTPAAEFAQLSILMARLEDMQLQITALAAIFTHLADVPVSGVKVEMQPAKQEECQQDRQGQAREVFSRQPGHGEDTGRLDEGEGHGEPGRHRQVQALEVFSRQAWHGEDTRRLDEAVAMEHQASTMKGDMKKQLPVAAAACVASPSIEKLKPGLTEAKALNKAKFGENVDAKESGHGFENHGIAWADSRRDSPSIEKLEGVEMSADEHVGEATAMAGEGGAPAYSYSLADIRIRISRIFDLEEPTPMQHRALRVLLELEDQLLAKEVPLYPT